MTEVLASPEPADMSQVECLETFAYVPGQGCIRLRQHMQRMIRDYQMISERYGGQRCSTDVDELGRKVLTQIGSSEQALRVRVTLSSGGAVKVTSTPFTDKKGTIQTIALSKQVVDHTDFWITVKSTHRTIYERIKADKPAEIFDTLISNDEGNVTECCVANVAFCFGEDWVSLDSSTVGEDILKAHHWVTPPLKDGMLPGILRHELVSKGLLKEESVPVNELRRSDTKFAMIAFNSLRGMYPCTLVL
eukprot:Clim_evm35s211 gene=Clim_evmTU35s211